MQPIIERLAQLHAKLEAAQLQGSALNSYRVFHGRGQTYSGLEFVTIDYFHPVLLITLFAEPPPQWQQHLVALLKPFERSAIECVLLQRRYLADTPSELLMGQLPAQNYAQRGSLRFHLHLGQQQNSGYFLDMEPGRQWLETRVAGKRLLNLFAYSCAFSVVAVAAGAENVVNVDMSRAALNLGRDNHRLNALDKTRSEYLAENILKSWGRIKRRGPYDLVIIDPPSYQKGSFIAAKDYVKVVRRLPELMPQGGLVLACLNAPELSEDYLRAQFEQTCPEAVFVERLRPSADFPDIDPQRQLKLLVYQLPAAAVVAS